MKKTTNRASSDNPRTVGVKGGREVVLVIDSAIETIFYKKLGRGFKRQTQSRLVAYGPWLMAAIHLLILPALLVLAREGRLVTVSGFIASVFFNQASWMLMLIVIINSLLLAAGLSAVFEKKKLGWNCQYIALIINGLYIAVQLLQRPSHFTAPIVSLIVIIFLLFSTLDVRKYYK